MSSCSAVSTRRTCRRSAPLASLGSNPGSASRARRHPRRSRTTPRTPTQWGAASSCTRRRNRWRAGRAGSRDCVRCPRSTNRPRNGGCKQRPSRQDAALGQGLKCLGEICGQRRVLHSRISIRPQAAYSINEGVAAAAGRVTTKERIETRPQSISIHAARFARCALDQRPLTAGRVATKERIETRPQSAYSINGSADFFGNVFLLSRFNSSNLPAISASRFARLQPWICFSSA